MAAANIRAFHEHQVHKNFVMNDTPGLSLIHILAQKLGCVVLLSGTEDLIADGQQLCTVRGGSDRMRTVTGAGCMLSVLCGAFAAVQPGDAFTAAVQAARFWKACAEQAEDHAAGAGSFRVALFRCV